ncbi:hypothetical protein [Vibrio vulnificus]
MVTFANKTWKAHWYIQGGDNPELAFSKDQWAVWRPVH